MALFKGKSKLDEKELIYLLKYFNVPVPKGHGTTIDLTELKKPDFLFTVNIKLM